MEEAETNDLPNLLCCQNESSKSDYLDLSSSSITEVSTLFICLFVCLFVCLFQMVPLVKNSTDTLVEKLGEFAESGRSVDVYR